jgi:hypothetical protein
MAQAQRRAIMTLALQSARKVVERQLRSTGRRLPDVEYKEIMMLAHDYLAQHPTELIAGAKAIVDRWHFGKRGGFRVRR